MSTRAPRSRRALVAVLALGFASLVSAGGASAYVLERAPEGPQVVTYYNGAPEHAWAVGHAVRAWAESGARIRFEKAPRDEAQIRIGFQPGPPVLAGDTALTYEGEGAAQRVTGAEVHLPHFADPRAAWSRRFTVVTIATHEIGHALGLGHEDSGCAVMNSVIENDVPSRCPQPPAGRWRCGLLELDDVSGAVALYGGRPRVSAPRLCPVRADARRSGAGRKPTHARAPAPPPAPSRVRVTLDRRGTGWSEVRWTNSPARDLREVVVARARGRCPADPHAPGARPVPAHSGAPGHLELLLTLGRWCYSLWSRDSHGRLSAHPRTARSSTAGGPAAPQAVTVHTGWPLAMTGLARVSWRTPDDVTVRTVEVVSEQSGCGASGRGTHTRELDLPAQAGERQSFVDFSFDSAGAPSRCYALRTRDALGGRSRAVLARAAA